MGRAAGDAATDLNHYSKRLTLAGVYAATLLVFVDDESDHWAETRAFLARRIEGVMRFERAKARGEGVGGGGRLSFARFMGRPRYPAICYAAPVRRFAPALSNRSAEAEGGKEGDVRGK